MYRSPFAATRPAILIVATTALVSGFAPAAALARTRAERIVERRLARILGPEAAARAVRAQDEQAAKEASPPRTAPKPTDPRAPAAQPRAATAARAAAPTAAPPRRLAAAGPLARLQAAKPAPAQPAALDADAAADLFAGRTPPFTAAWYAEHPQAWRHEQPETDWWRPLDPDALVAWLDKPRFAAGAEPATPGVWTIDEPAGAAADGTRSVLVNAAEPDGDAAWQPLGVFAAAPAGVARPLALQQLAVGRDGSIRGNHLDAVSGVVQPISGTLDAAGRRAAWTVGAAGARFEARLDDLAAPTAAVAVRTAGGAESWALARVADPGASTPAPAGAPVELLPTP